MTDQDYAREASYRVDDRVYDNWLDNAGRDARDARDARDGRNLQEPPAWHDADPEHGPVLWGWPGFPGGWMGESRGKRDERANATAVVASAMVNGAGKSPGSPMVNGPPVMALPWPRRAMRSIVPAAGVFAGESVRVIGESRGCPGVWFVEGKGARVGVIEGLDA